MALVSLKQAIADLNVVTSDCKFTNSDKYVYKDTEIHKKMLIAPTTDEWEIEGETRNYVVLFVFSEALAKEMPEINDTRKSQDACLAWLGKNINGLKANNDPQTQDGDKSCFSNVFRQETVDLGSIL